MRFLLRFTLRSIYTIIRSTIIIIILDILLTTLLAFALKIPATLRPDRFNENGKNRRRRAEITSEVARIAKSFRGSGSTGNRPRTREGNRKKERERDVFTSLAEVRHSGFDSSRWSYNLQPSALPLFLPPPPCLPTCPPFLTFHTYSRGRLFRRAREPEPQSFEPSFNSVPE